jgi:hypothetical protein
MAAEDRSFSELFQSIVGNVQEIVRAEVRLAKAELRRRLKTKALTAIFAAGMKRLREVHPAPERTVESIKENVEWAKQQVK